MNEEMKDPIILPSGEDLKKPLRHRDPRKGRLLLLALGGIVVLLLWLYFSGIVLVMGAHLNYIVMTGAAWRSRQSFIMSGNAPYYVFKD